MILFARHGNASVTWEQISNLLLKERAQTTANVKYGKWKIWCNLHVEQTGMISQSQGEDKMVNVGWRVMENLSTLLEVSCGCFDLEIDMNELKMFKAGTNPIRQHRRKLTRFQHHARLLCGIRDGTEPIYAGMCFSEKGSKVEGSKEIFFGNF